MIQSRHLVDLAGARRLTASEALALLMVACHEAGHEVIVPIGVTVWEMLDIIDSSPLPVVVREAILASEMFEVEQ